MKKIVTLFLISPLVFEGCVTRKIVTKETLHTYYTVFFAPEQTTKKVGTEIEVTIKPIDAKILNQETSEAAKRDGNYEKELALLIESKKSELNNMSKADKAIFTGKINAINKLRDLVSKGEITSEVGYSLQLRIWNGEEYGKDGTEASSLSEIDNYPGEFNPFKINDKFLSVFKVTFENNGTDIEEFSLKDFQVISGEEQLYPLAMEYFENNLKEEPEKIKNAYRLNMPNKLTLTSNQRITKYLAVPAINSMNNSLKIQYIKGKNVVSFDFDVTAKESKKNYTSERYYILLKQELDPLYYDTFYAVKYSNGVSFATLTDRFYVSADKKSSLITVYVISIGKKSSKVYFGKRENISFLQIKNNLISVDLKTKSD